MLILFGRFVLAWFVQVLLVDRIVGGRLTCSLDQYTIKMNDTVECVDCSVCPPGSGSSPQCGAFLRKILTSVCVSCLVGVSYSSLTDTTSCEPCTICVEDEIVIRNCTPTSNTICGKCKPGYYRSFINSCKKCSTCCDDAQTEDIVPQCLRQGLPRSRACRYSGRACGKRPKLASSTKAQPTTDKIAQKSQEIAVMFYIMAGVSVSIAFWLVLLLWFFYRRYRPIDCCYKAETTPRQETLLRLPSDQQLAKSLDGEV